MKRDEGRLRESERGERREIKRGGETEEIHGRCIKCNKPHTER